MISKWPTAGEIAAGSPEFDGSVPSCRQPQQIVASAIDHRCSCSKSAAKPRLQVETLVPLGRTNRRPICKAGGFGDSPSAIRPSFVQPQSVPSHAKGRNMQCEYGNL